MPDPGGGYSGPEASKQVNRKTDWSGKTDLWTMVLFLLSSSKDQVGFGKYFSSHCDMKPWVSQSALFWYLKA